VRSLDPLGGEIRRELVRLGPGGAIADVVAVWPAAVGPAIAANAWPARIARDGTLHVSTSSSAWAFELTHLEDTVRARLGEHLGEGAPPRLRFATGRLPESGAESVESSERVVPRPSPAALAAAEELSAGIEDQELREAVSKAAAASLTRSDARSDDRSF
jgi:hypothetical protein